MKSKKLEQIKTKALQDHIPIIMDDTLSEIEKRMKENLPNNILEIGTAVRIFSNMFFIIFKK